MNGKKFIKDNLFVLICAAITFVCVLSAAITFKQHPLKTLPLFVSLVVMLLQARVSRYAFLLGGLNSVLYALSYSLMGLYASAIYALVSSFPLQIITFINWRRKTSGGVTELRKMSGGVRLLVLLGFALVWPAVYFTISSLPGATQSALDVTGTLIGLLVTVLSMLRFSEYAPLNLVSVAISLTTHTMIFLSDTSNITYVIYTLYSGICLTAAMIRMKKAKLVK
ncbi:MAG: nicotinamide mononucleotide transporter [Clostridia bacterium]|nr:nicotinamide mononucleotide transporter [Clostridia bacterium]